jgi:hypothetical protein
MALKCIICERPMDFFLTKKFNEYGLGDVDYLKCPQCGFVVSETHAALSGPEWEKLNADYHAQFLGKSVNQDDLRWLDRLDAQARFIDRSKQAGLISQQHPWLDYACGDGKLSALLQSKHGLELKKYERYTETASDYLTESDLRPAGFDFVITTSVFEHLFLRQDFDFIDSLVSANGVMGLHTLVRESIPQDPSWFYFLPVHCAFHTNASMRLLLKQWGYSHSVYDVESRLWLCFRETPTAQLERAALAGPASAFLHQAGFLDYWK